MRGVCNYGYVPRNHLWNIVVRNETTTRHQMVVEIYFEHKSIPNWSVASCSQACFYNPFPQVDYIAFVVVGRVGCLGLTGVYSLVLKLQVFSQFPCKQQTN